MGNLAELLEHLGTDEFRQGMIEAATKTLMHDQNDTPDQAPPSDGWRDTWPPTRPAQDTAMEILEAIRKWQTQHRKPFPGYIAASVYDLREIDQQQKGAQHGDSLVTPISKLAVGDVGTLWGVRVLADERPAGTWELLT